MGVFESFIGVNFWTALFTLLNFLVLFFVMKRFLVGPVLQLIQDRRQEIEDLYLDAGNAKDSAQAMEAEYKEKLATASQTGERLIREAVARGKIREEEIIRTAKAEATAIMDKAAADIAMEKKNAINDAKNEISGIAVAIAEKVLGRELGLADQSRLIDEFINNLGDRL